MVMVSVKTLMSLTIYSGRAKDMMRIALALELTSCAPAVWKTNAKRRIANNFFIFQ